MPYSFETSFFIENAANSVRPDTALMTVRQLGHAYKKGYFDEMSTVEQDVKRAKSSLNAT